MNVQKRISLGISALIAIVIFLVIVDNNLRDEEPKQIDNKSRDETTIIEIGYSPLDIFLPICRTKNVWWLRWEHWNCWFGNETAKAYYYHTMIIIRNPNNGKEFYVDAGPTNCDTDDEPLDSGSSTGRRTKRCCDDPKQACAVAEYLTDEKAGYIKFRQPVKQVALRFEDVQKEMKSWEKLFNTQGNKYTFNEKNCNYFSYTVLSSLLNSLGIKPPKPVVDDPILVPGWGKGKYGLLNIIREG